MSYSKYPTILAELRQDHRVFTRIISALDDELQKIRCGKSENWKRLAESFEYFEAYADLVHHPREDIVYRYCREVCTATTPALEVLEREHAQIADKTARLKHRLDEVFADGVLNREALITDIEGYLTMQKAHMRCEEGTIFPMLLDTLDEADWARLLQTARSAVDSLYDDGARQAYDALYQRIVGGAL